MTQTTAPIAPITDTTTTTTTQAQTTKPQLTDDMTLEEAQKAKVDLAATWTNDFAKHALARHPVRVK